MADSKDGLSKLYPLPHASSAEEGGRLDEQHDMIKLLLNGLYPCPDIVAEVMMDEGGQAKSVLDLGSGSGAWCLDVAKQFPHAQVIGVNITPNSQKTHSHNCRFETWDINQGLSPFYGQFDLVHMRFVHSLVDHHTSTLEAIRCLKPGGLILFLKAGPEVTEDRTTLIPAASSRMPDQSWYQRFWAFAELGPTRRGASTEIYNRDFDEGFWDYDIMDAETCGAAFITFPLGAWVITPDPVETERLKRVGEFWRKNIMRIHRLLESLMISAGRSQKDVELLHTRLDNDLQTARFRSSVTMRAIWGRARSAGHTKSQQQEPFSNPDMSSSVLSNKPGEYRVITTFNDKPAWTEFNTRLISTMTSDTKVLREIPGFDLIEA